MFYFVRLDDKIRMLRFGETEGSIMKKYSIEAYLRKIEDQNSMNVGIRKSVSVYFDQLRFIGYIFNSYFS